MYPSELKGLCRVTRCSSLPAVYICLQLVLVIFTTQGNAVPDIMFPDSLTKLEPKCLKNETSKTLCTKIENYPKDQLDRLIQADSKRYMDLFGADLVVDVVTRFDNPGEEPLCIGNERLIFPQSGRNQDGTMRIIVNHDERKQGIRVEECSNAGTSCYMTQHFPNEYSTECRQEYIFRPLLIFSPDGNGQIVKDQIRFPSNCKCVLKTGGM